MGRRKDPNSLGSKAELAGLNYDTVVTRKRRGWSEDDLCISIEEAKEKRLERGIYTKHKETGTYIECMGHRRNISEWAKELGITRQALWSQYNKYPENIEHYIRYKMSLHKKKKK